MKRYLLQLVFLVLLSGTVSKVYGQGDDNMYPQGSDVKVPEPLPLPEFPIVNGNVVYQKVFEFEGADTGTLYGIALRYVSEYYRSAKTVIDVTDPISGLVVVKGNFSITSDVYFRFFGTMKSQREQRTAHTLKIECRPGRVRVTIDNLQVIQEAYPDLGVPYSEIPISDLIKAANQYESYAASEKPKKGEKLKQVNRTILLDELDLKASLFLQELRPFFGKELAEDW